MPAPIFPTAPFLSELVYTTPFGQHVLTSFFGTLVPSVTGDPSGHDYAYGASNGLGWQTRYNDFILGVAAALSTTVTLQTLTLFKNPSPGIVPPIPVYTDAISSAGTGTTAAIESSEATFTWADAANKKMKIVLLDVWKVPPAKVPINTAVGSVGALFRQAVLVEQVVTTRDFTPVVRALTESVKYNRRFMRKRGQ
jgi:hypothetical protein